MKQSAPYREKSPVRKRKKKEGKKNDGIGGVVVLIVVAALLALMQRSGTSHASYVTGDRAAGIIPPAPSGQ